MLLRARWIKTNVFLQFSWVEFTCCERTLKRSLHRINWNELEFETRRPTVTFTSHEMEIANCVLRLWPISTNWVDRSCRLVQFLQPDSSQPTKRLTQPNATQPIAKWKLWTHKATRSTTQSNSVRPTTNLRAQRRRLRRSISQKHYDCHQ